MHMGERDDFGRQRKSMADSPVQLKVIVPPPHIISSPKLTVHSQMPPHRSSHLEITKINYQTKIVIDSSRFYVLSFFFNLTTLK